MRLFLVIVTVVGYFGLLLVGGSPLNISTSANPFNSKVQPKEVTLGRDAKATGQGSKSVLFTHDTHSLRPYSADGKSVIGCAECHHTDQPKRALKGVLRTSEREEMLTTASLEKADAKPVKTCRECHAQTDVKPALWPASPEVTYPDEDAPITLNNEEAYHRNCNVCHDAVKKRNPATKAPVTCVQCHNGAAPPIGRVASTVCGTATPCPTPRSSSLPTVGPSPPTVSFISREDTFRRLAETLASEGRLNEATGAIGLMKKEEYFNYRSPDAKEAEILNDPQDIRKKLAAIEAELKLLSAKQPRTATEQERLEKLEEALRVSKAIAKILPDRTPRESLVKLTPTEAERVSDFSNMRERLVAFGVERRELRAKQARTPLEQERLDKLDEYIKVAGKVFDDLVGQLFVEFAGSPGSIDRVFGLIESKALMQDLKEMGSGAVALYTIVGKERYRVILITPDVTVSGETSITANDLQTKVREFRDALQNPNANPLPLARELYNILLGPVAKDLKAARAETLMWSLDGPLRYLPFAALHDGEKYVVESYRTTVFTPASLARLKDTPSQAWRGLGLGVSKAHSGFPPLPGVPVELRGIIRAANENLTSGVMSGKRMLDEEFTLKSMNKVLQEDFTVLHIASHFYLQRGTDADSFLLLGDGSRLSLSQLRVYQNPFGGMDLVTLSACETALGSVNATGREIEGFAVLAQTLGAKAVIASLWNVSDESTSQLMQEFYRLRAAPPRKPKAEALRLAQLALLKGNKKSAGVSDQGQGRSIRLDMRKTLGKGNYTHPYFWAPFILIGNWK